MKDELKIDTGELIEEEESRSNTDLDSIVAGTAGKGGQVKIYFNSRRDTLEEIKARVDKGVLGAEYLRIKLGEGK